MCVARLKFGDEFVNEGGAIAVCAEFGASCAAGSAFTGPGARDLQCSCAVDEASRPCPACKCSTAHPVFNGSKCKTSM